LSYENGDAARGTGNSRNRYPDTTVLIENGALDVAVPRDRNATFEPAIGSNGEHRMERFALSSFITLSQNLAPSVCSICEPKTSSSPSAANPALACLSVAPRITTRESR